MDPNIWDAITLIDKAYEEGWEKGYQEGWTDGCQDTRREWHRWLLFAVSFATCVAVGTAYVLWLWFL